MRARGRSSCRCQSGARGGASLFGKTLETVLAERPCRVIIESAPVSAAQRTNAAQAPRAHRAGTRSSPAR